MAATASLKVIKQFVYRGGVRQYANRYHFDGTTPPDSTHWTTLSDAVVAAEKLIFQNITDDSVNQLEIVQTIGYAPGSDVPVFSKTYTQHGTATLTNYGFLPGEVAGLIRYSTDQRTSKNHPVYLFNYYHDVKLETSVSGDELNHSQKTLMLTYANAWISGFSDGAVTHHRAGPNGAVALGAIVEEFLTHRDFPK